MKKTAGAFSPFIVVNREAGTPLYRQVYDGLRSAITGRRLQPGQQIPSTRALAEELGISRIPVLIAYDQLITEGYVQGKVGAGTFVSSSLPEQMMFSGAAGSPASQPRSGPVKISRGATALPGLNHEPWTYRPGAFSAGELGFDHFPFQVWANLVNRHARRITKSAMNYSGPMGSRQFREIIAAYLRTSRAVQCDARQIMVVSGSQQALDLTVRVLLDAGSPVWVEEPGYGFMRTALTLAGCRLIPVPVDGEGMDVSAGVTLCRKASAAYVTPSHQFPLGVTMSASRRLQLLEWARNSGAWIIEDDYDSEYRYESMPIASLQGLDHGSRVIYIGTFSKTLFPALRLGYIVIPSDLVERFAAVRRAVDICPPHFNQAVLADFIEGGHFARHIRKTRLLYGERRSALAGAIRKEFGSRLQILGGEAGLHLAVTLPTEYGGQELSDQEISTRGAARKLWLWPLSPLYLGNPKQQGFILGFASTEAHDMAKAVRRLSELLPP